MADQPLPNSPFRQHGRWRLPQVPELSNIELSGELMWDPFDGATLELSVPYEQSNLISPLFGSSVLVQGQMANLPLVTIDHALVESINHSLGGDAKIKLSSYSMVKGQAWVEDVAATELVHMAAEMTGLREWIGGTSIVVASNEDGSISVNCRPSESRAFARVNGFSVAIDLSVRQGFGEGKYLAQDSAVFSISAPNRFTYQQAQELVWELNRFLSFSLDLPVITTTVIARLPDNSEVLPDGRPVPRWLEFYQSIDRNQWKKASKPQRDNRVVLPFQDSERIEDAYLHFSRIYRAHRRALDFYFSGGNPSDSYVHQRFADMVHGMEGIDRGLNGGCYMEASNYEANVVMVLRAAMPRDMPDALRSALKDRLRYGNGFSLRKRLKNLAAKHSYLSGVLGKPSHFGDDVADMRNDLAHAKGNESPSREDVMRYVGMLYRVKLLFQMELLLHLGFDEDFRRNALRRLGSVEIAARPFARPLRPEPEAPESHGVEPVFEIHVAADGSVVLPQSIRDAIGANVGTTLQVQTTAEGNILLF